MRETINLLLRLDGYTVAEAGTGAVALDLCMRGHFDLVITNFEMPNMNHCHPTGIGKKKVGSFQRTCHTAGK